MAQQKTNKNCLIRYADSLTVTASDPGGGGEFAAFDDDDDILGSEYPEGLLAGLDTEDIEIVEIINIGGGVELGAFDDLDDSTEEIELFVPLADGQSAVVLNKVDGVYQWEFPLSLTQVSGEALGFDADDETRYAVFKQTFEPIADTDSEELGLDFDRVLKPFKKLILRFAGIGAVAALSKYLERKIVEGPILISGDTWSHTPGIENQSLSGKPVLLMIHGTFSSTLGSYGDLTGTEEGERFLNAAQQSYGLVLGYDHKTLTKTVDKNAQDIFDALAQLPGSQPITIDAVGFSRGGLVLRYLERLILADTGNRFRLRNATFVGCTNSGTILAEPDNWEDLVNLYTNLVVAASRLAPRVLGPQVAPAAKVFEGAMKGLLSFVKYLADVTISDRAVPGLASMEPDGREVLEINRTSDQSGTATTTYTAITADFGSQFIFGDNAQANGLSRRIVLEGLDNLSDRLIKESNDLVVNQSSMTQVSVGETTDTHDFANDSGVYHTIYFKQAETARHLMQWLIGSDVNTNDA